MSQAIQDTKLLFDQILLGEQLQKEKQHYDYTQLLGNITRDTSEIHVMAVHLSYENQRCKA